MNQINFLPNSYRIRLGTRTRRVREASLVGIFALCLGAYWAYGLSDAMQLRGQALRTEDHLAHVLSIEQQVETLKESKKRLIEQRTLQREIRVPIRHHELIRTIGALMPESTALTSLSLVNDRPAPKPYVAPGEKAAAKPSFKAKSQTDEVDRVQIDLAGLAPDDLAVAEFIAALSAHPLIQGVKLNSSRQLAVQGVLAREFRLTGYVDLTREVVWMDETAPYPDDAPEAVAEVNDAHP